MKTEAVMPFEALTLAAVVAELRQSVLPARVQKIQQPSASEIVLSLYGKSGPCRLLLSADPKLFRIHPTQQRRENPITPLGFCQVCRKYLDGTILTDITMARFDRVARVNFRSQEAGNVAIVAELMGRNANLILLSGAEIVRGTLRAAPASSERALKIGGVYQDPPGLNDRRDLITVTDAEDRVFDGMPTEDAETRTFLADRFSGVGRFVADEIMARATPEKGATGAVIAFAETIRNEQFVPFSIVSATGKTVGVAAIEPLSFPRERRFARESLFVALDTLYAGFTGTEPDDSAERIQLVATLAKEIAFREKELTSARRTIAEASRAEEYERAGNNLLAHLAEITRGQSTVRVSDLYAEAPGGSADIELDPKRSPQENAASYFARARKVRDAADYADGHAVDLEEDLGRLRYLEKRVEGSPPDEKEIDQIRASLAEIVGAVRAARPAKTGETRGVAKTHKPYGGFKIRKFDVNGYELLIGESAEANDYLTTRMATPSDYWMHVRSAPGAHAILRTGGLPQRMPESVIRRAAEIVAARSGTNVKHAGLVAVDIVEKRYVRKPRGAKAGLVSYERERVVDVEPRL